MRFIGKTITNLKVWLKTRREENAYVQFYILD